MAISHRLKTGLFILKNDGLAAFLKASAAYLNALRKPGSPDESKIAFEILKAAEIKGVMIDVGAHWGSALAPFARRGWEVFCFEPDPENRKRLEYLFGHLPNVKIDPRAVSDRPKEGGVLYKSEESTGISALSPFRPTHRPAYKVNVTTLKSFFEEKGLSSPAVDFLKIDAEGFDLHVLRGFPWGRVAPRLILCEFDDAKTGPLGYSFHDLAGFLQKYGYRLVVSEWYPVESYNTPHSWRRFTRYPCVLKNQEGWGNIFALKEKEMYDFLIELCEIEPF
ncbi:MAG TPA: FkbM family methyltransferase [Deltaproteobacteria bacterium]|nr:FkbM family methyltransferase [Deltaproteobacteria bacterium]HDZ89214.1 FkbM family methyltransferase [Deltaproteobacteria bacterium]